MWGLIENESSKIVQFSHFSIKEFLTSDRLRVFDIRNTCHYHIPFDVAQTILARACPTVLLQLGRKRGQEAPIDVSSGIYVAQHWVDHAEYVSSRIQDAMEQLFNSSKSYLASWTWIHNVDSNRVRETVHASQRTPDAAECSHVVLRSSMLIQYLIITHGEKVKAECGNHKNPLHAAARKGHLDAVRLSLADANATNRSKKPLCARHLMVDIWMLCGRC